MRYIDKSTPMETRTFFVLFLFFVALKSQSQTIIKRQIEVSSDKIWQIEEFAESFAKEVGDSLVSQYPVSVDYLGVALTRCTDPSFFITYEARLHETNQGDADYRIIRVGYTAIAKNLTRAQNKALRHAHNKSDAQKIPILKMYGKSRVRVVLISDHKTSCPPKKSICVVEKFIVVKKLTQIL